MKSRNFQKTVRCLALLASLCLSVFFDALAQPLVPEVRVQLQQDIDRFFVSDDSRFFATAGGISPESVTLWDARSMRQLRDLPCQLPSTTGSWRIRFNDDSSRIGILCVDETSTQVLRVFAISGGLLEDEIKAGDYQPILDFSFTQQVYLTREYDTYALVSLDSGEQTASWDGSLVHAEILSGTGDVFGIQRGEIVMLDSETLQELYRYPINSEQGWVSVTRHSPDQSMVALLYPPRQLYEMVDGDLYQNPHHLEVYEHATGRQLISKPFPSFDTELDFSAGSQHIIFTGISEKRDEWGSNIRTLEKLDVHSGERTTLQLYGLRQSPALTRFDEQGRIIAGNEQQVYIFNEQLGVTERIAPEGVQPEYVEFSMLNDNRRAVVRSGRSMQVLDYSNPALFQQVNHDESMVLEFAGNGWWLADDPESYTETETDFEMIYVLYHPDNLLAPKRFHLTNTYITDVVVTHYGELIIGAPDYSGNRMYIRSISMDSGEILAEYSLPLDAFRTHVYGSISLSADGRYLAVLARNDQQNAIRILDTQNRLEAVKTLESAAYITPTESPGSFVTQSYLDDEAGNTWIHYHLHDLENPGATVEIGRHFNFGYIPDMLVSGNRLYITRQNYIAAWELDGGGEYERLPLVSGRNSRFSAITGNAVVMSRENRIVWLNPNDFTEKHQAFVSAEKGVTMVLTDGTYFSWAGTVPDHINFTAGASAFSYDQFDVLYNRPDKVLAHLGAADETLIGLYEQAYEKRVSFLGGRLPVLGEAMPEVRVHREGLEPVTHERTIELLVDVSDPESPLRTLHVSVNGVPVYGKNGMQINSAAGERITKKLDIELGFGMNRIDIKAENTNGVQSLSEVVEIRLLGEAPLPTLYVLTIGVSDYLNDDLDLEFAAKDAVDIMMLYERHGIELLDKGPQFREYFEFDLEQLREIAGLEPKSFANVEARLLTDRRATREAILNTRSFLEQARVDDQVLIFMAGHGFLDDALDYYFAPTDYDVDNPAAKGIRFDEIEALIDGIPARRRLLIMDTCHAGELDRSIVEESTAQDSGSEAGQMRSRTIGISETPVIGLQNSFDLMRSLFADLRHSTGMVTLSAAAGVELAYETRSYRNGLFTSAYLDHIMNGDTTQPLYIQLERIAEIVRQRSNGLQSPQFRSENRLLNIYLW